MSMLRRFNEAFGLETSIERERARFVNRIEDAVFDWAGGLSNWPSWFKDVCFELGVGTGEVARLTRSSTPGAVVMTLRHSGDYLGEFEATILVVCALRAAFDHRAKLAGDPPRLAQIVDVAVDRALALSTVDIGVRWHAGMFYPSGAEELDRKLVDDSLRWLDSFPDAKELFRKAVSDYASKRYSDAVEEGFKTLERLTAAFLGNERSLDNNKGELLARAGLSSEWGSILNKVMLFANNYARHAAQAEVELAPAEVEAFIYQVGLLVRLILQRIESPAAPAN